MKKITVGSTNPAKIKAVKMAFEKIWPQESWEVIGVTVSSSVSDQPMSADEAITGARNRARQSLEKTADGIYGVGLEGGLQKIQDKYFETGWAVVVNREGIEGVGSSIKIEVAGELLKLIHSGIELGLAMDKVLGQTNTKHGQGYFGTMTNGIISRSQGYSDGLIAALSKFLHPELYE